jgi:hypothetical protein
MSEVNMGVLCADFKTEELRFLTFDDGEYYVVARTAPDSAVVHISVSAGKQVQTRLIEQAQQWLYEKKFRRKRASQDFSMTFVRADFDPVKGMALVRGVFETALGRPMPVGRLLTVPTITIENQAVIEAMTYLAKARDWAARKTLYRLLIDAWLVVALDESGEIMLEDKMGTWPVCAVYLNQAAFIQRYPVGRLYRLVQGRDLFPELVIAKYGALRINPKNEVRGELYFNELKMIRDGIIRLDEHQNRLRAQEK